MRFSCFGFAFMTLISAKSDMRHIVKLPFLRCLLLFLERLANTFVKSSMKVLDEKTQQLVVNSLQQMIRNH